MTDTFDELVMEYISDDYIFDGVTRINNFLDDLDFENRYDELFKEGGVDDAWENFIEENFNNWDDNPDYNFDFWITQVTDRDFDDLISASHLLKNLKDAVKWFKEEYDVDLDITKDDRHVINSIAYYIVSNCSHSKGNFKFEFKKRLDDVKKLREYSGESRYTCVICLENKLIYTGCSSCNSAFVCAGCYPKLYNNCPVCRCDQMIKCINCRHLIRTGDSFEVIEGLDKWVVNFDDVGRAIRGEWIVKPKKKIARKKVV